MNRIARAFENGKAFIGFLTAGDPSMEKTEEFILEMARAGADLIEIGIPFSDPIAEGPVIQEASLRALKAGATVDKVFEMVGSVRRKIDTPLVFMTYLNPVFHWGYDSFFARCRETGVDGIIIPDLPYEEKREVSDAAQPYGVSVISLIAPTSAQRIQTIASQAEGFLYVVSSMGVTGERSEITTDLPSIISLVKKASSIPAAVGFGIHTPEQAQEIAGFSDGVIVGSAIVKLIARDGSNAGPAVFSYVRSMKEAVQRGGAQTT